LARSIRDRDDVIAVTREPSCDGITVTIAT
jgi:hypothetical protein